MNNNIAEHAEREPSSFRDPAGNVFVLQDGSIARSIMPVFAEHWKICSESGFFAACVKQSLLPAFSEIKPLPHAWKTVAVEKIPYISYPYEWSFSQLQSAALLTLKLQKMALQHSLSMKDASAYNVQFIGAQPIFIDLLSFEKYKEGQPWIAYGQFCRHFLAPLLLMCKVSPLFNKNLVSFLDGFPLDIASSVLPFLSKCNPSIFMHIVMHGKTQTKHVDSRFSAKKMQETYVSQKTIFNLIDSLQALISGLTLPNYATEWGDYYNNTNYTQSSFDAKHSIIEKIYEEIASKNKITTIMDLGANNGEFSSIAAQFADYVLSPDIDPIAVHVHHKKLLQQRSVNILPMLLDIANPSPAIGWENEERASFIDRTHVDICQALALIHHLAIGNNVPLPRIADFFAKICKTLLLEFVPKQDSQVQRMLTAREDIFENYTLSHCIDAFSQYFTLEEQIAIPNSKRTLLVLRKKG